MKQIAAEIAKFGQKEIKEFEAAEKYQLEIEGQIVELSLEDAEIATQDIPGWAVSNIGSLTVALDLTLTPELVREGMARELVNRIQNMRKDQGFDVVDKINVKIAGSEEVFAAIDGNFDYICSETLTLSLTKHSGIENTEAFELVEGEEVFILVEKI